MEFADDLHFLGVTKVKGSLRGFSFQFEKELEVMTTLESTRGSIIAASSINIGRDMISKGDIMIKGTCEVAGQITGRNIRLTSDSVNVNSIIGQIVQIRGKITVSNGISASKAIYMRLNQKKDPVHIDGSLQAPKIVLFYGGFYTKLYKVPNAILGVLGKKRRVRRLLIIEDLSIKTDKLVIKTYYQPERVEVQYINCTIEAKETELAMVEV
jgi:hypothetical protein